MGRCQVLPWLLGLLTVVCCVVMQPAFLVPSLGGIGLRVSTLTAASTMVNGQGISSSASSASVGTFILTATLAMSFARKRQQESTSRGGSLLMMAEAVAAEPAAPAKEEEEAAKPPPPPPFDPAQQLGVTEPLGFFDPLGFSKVGDEKGFRNLRAAELKHGRVAMMAAAGAVFQHFARLPFFFDFEPAGMDAVKGPNGKYGTVLLFLISGFVELFVWVEDSDKQPGDFGDPLGLNIYDKDMRNRELNNGRFAMFAALGIVAADLYTGKDAIEQLGGGPSMIGGL